MPLLLSLHRQMSLWWMAMHHSDVINGFDPFGAFDGADALNGSMPSMPPMPPMASMASMPSMPSMHSMPSMPSMPLMPWLSCDGFDGFNAFDGFDAFDGMNAFGGIEGAFDGFDAVDNFLCRRCLLCLHAVNAFEAFNAFHALDVLMASMLPYIPLCFIVSVGICRFHECPWTPWISMESMYVDGIHVGDTPIKSMESLRGLAPHRYTGEGISGKESAAHSTLVSPNRRSYTSIPIHRNAILVLSNISNPCIHVASSH